uniref:Uncharacterized protein n=1 Tax=Ananas comosus var. bracteatus TaxID=296719 RepID=A0A6V7P4N6_ANACO|nr:unnamed protein product [Ananas comosus var. bracteatus]
MSRQGERRQQAPSGRVYAAQVEDSTATNRVVAGITLISGIRARTLFDTGASHFFVSRAFASLHGLEVGPLSHTREVQIPDHILQVAECCWSCPVQLDSWIMPADLLVLGQLQDFDVVLGMNWLARYYATIDCGARTVTFREPCQEEFTFRGCRSTLFATWISSARARQLMSRGCTAFLATVVEVPTAVPGLEDIPIVCEFQDVFPPKLTTMPPERKVEFVIDVVLGTAPISKAPYLHRQCKD